MLERPTLTRAWVLLHRDGRMLTRMVKLRSRAPADRWLRLVCAKVQRRPMEQAAGGVVRDVPFGVWKHAGNARAVESDDGRLEKGIRRFYRSGKALA